MKFSFDDVITNAQIDTNRALKNLNPCQRDIFKDLISGENVFITGVAGTGKSYLLNTFNEYIGKMKNLCIVAPTGLAAYLVGGVTIHSQFALGTGVQEPRLNYTNYVSHLSPRLKEILFNLDIIEIEEVSMVRFDVFRRVMKILDAEEERRYDNAHKKWELLSERASDFTEIPPEPCPKDFKIQRILCGDFGQLCPILTTDKKSKNGKYLSEKDVFKSFYPSISPEGWAFLDEHWKQFKFKELTQVMRQQDRDFVYALNRVRVGDLQGLQYINEHCGKEYDEDSVVLCGTNKQVQDVNNGFLNSLQGKLYKFELVVTYNEEFKNEGVKIDSSLVPVDQVLRVKVGAKVMVLINDFEQPTDMRYRNGSFGVVTAIRPAGTVFNGRDVKEDEIDVYLQDNDLTVTFTPHIWKINGYTVESAYIEFHGKYFLRKMVEDYKKRNPFLSDESVLQYFFNAHREETDLTKVDKKYLKTVELGTITGMPLRLRYAMTVHKSQGHTFDSVAIFPKFWEFGQLYTALSRVKSLDKLYLYKPIESTHLKTSSLVNEFYRNKGKVSESSFSAVGQLNF